MAEVIEDIEKLKFVERLEDKCVEKVTYVTRYHKSAPFSVSISRKPRDISCFEVVGARSAVVEWRGSGGVVERFSIDQSKVIDLSQPKYVLIRDLFSPLQRALDKMDANHPMRRLFDVVKRYGEPLVAFDAEGDGRKIVILTIERNIPLIGRFLGKSPRELKALVLDGCEQVKRGDLGEVVECKGAHRGVVKFHVGGEVFTPQYALPLDDELVLSTKLKLKKDYRIHDAIIDLRPFLVLHGDKDIYIVRGDGCLMVLRDCVGRYFEDERREEKIPIPNCTPKTTLARIKEAAAKVLKAIGGGEEGEKKQEEPAPPQASPT